MTILVLAIALTFTAPVRPPTADALGWMAGSWEGEEGGLQMEETWTAPRAGTLLGVHRDVKGTRTVGFEFMRIEDTKDGLVYFAMPQGRPATPFTAIALKQERVVFENLKHDFPHRILYWIGPGGALHARIEGMQDGKPAAQEWRWTKK